MRKVKWKDVKIGDKMDDGSKVTQLHPIHEMETYKLKYGSVFSKETMVLSSDHLLLCDISKIEESIKTEIIETLKGHKIPTEVDYNVTVKEDLSMLEQAKLKSHLTGDSGMEIEDSAIATIEIESVLEKCEFEEIVVSSGFCIESEDNVWLTVETINQLLNYNQKIICNGHNIYESRYSGAKQVRCVSTNTGEYQAKGLKHHNSVAVRNIILHSLTHVSDMSVGLIDLKQTEFSYFKGKEGVVGVANEVQEAVELLRIGRDVMYKRNKEMAALGLTDMIDFVPKDPTDKIKVSGRDLYEDDIVKVRVEGGEEKEMTAAELLELVQEIG